MAVVSAAWPRAARILALILVAVGGLLAFRPDAVIFTTPLTEDSYYSLSVARNIAAGRGVTIDGTLPTNGFQPLFTFMEAGAYALAGGDEKLGVRLVLGLSWAIWIATALILGRIARDGAGGTPAEKTTRGWMATLLYLSGFLTFMHHFNGLETGLLMLGYTSLWRAWQVGVYERTNGPLWIGALLGLLVLTRIDAAIFTALFGLWLLWQETRRFGFLAALKRLVPMGLAALLISAPWWAYNYLEFGSLMPTSGTAQQEWAINERRLRWIFWALGVAGVPQLWLGQWDEMFHDGILLSVLRALVGGGLLWGFWRALSQRKPFAQKEPKPRRTWEFAALLAGALLVLCLYYGFSFIAYWFYYRYLFFFVLLATVGLAWLLAPWVAQDRGRAQLAALVFWVLAAPTLASALMAQTGKTLHVETVYFEQLALIKEHVPDDARVAAGQSGTLGYFRPSSVNVDGKVNRAAVPYQARMWDYLRENNIVWFCDWPNYVEKYLGDDPTRHGWKLVAEKGFWRLWKYEGPS